MTTKHDKRSPIKNLPVRLPGQSISEEQERILDKVLLYWLVPIALLSYAAFVAWLRPAPVVPTVFAAIYLVIGSVKIWQGYQKIKRLRLGRIGEEAVGQFLEEKLRPLGYQVLHDIPGDGFNTDHVVVGTTGIYTVETKTHSKPAKGPCKVDYDGEKVTVNGFTPERDPVVQAKAQARWLRNTLEESTGKRFKIQPVVLYPGWFVQSSVQWPDVWVQNEKQFPLTLAHQQPFIEEPDVHLITYHLKRYVISQRG